MLLYPALFVDLKEKIIHDRKCLPFSHSDQKEEASVVFIGW